MTDTDAFKFSSLKIFNSCGNLADGAREICDVFEDLVFVWNFKESNLLVANWRSAQSKEASAIKYQVRSSLYCSIHTHNQIVVLDTDSIVDAEFHNLQSFRVKWRNFRGYQRSSRSVNHGDAITMGI